MKALMTTQCPNERVSHLVHVEEGEHIAAGALIQAEQAREL